MLRRLYDNTIAYAQSPRAPYLLAAVSFAESSFFPVPPDVMLAPMAMARPERAWHYAAICTLASVLGGVLGYAIGAYFYDTVGQWVFNLYGYAQRLETFRAWYQDYGHWVILVKGLLPIPYKLVTIASGLAGYSLFWFVVLSALTRGVRFFAVAGLFNRFGSVWRPFIEANLGMVAALTVAIIIGGFALAKFLV